MSGKGSSPGGGWALEQAPQGSGHGPKLLEFKKHSDNALRNMDWIMGGGGCVKPGVGLGDCCRSLSLRDILWFYITQECNTFQQQAGQLFLVWLSHLFICYQSRTGICWKTEAIRWISTTGKVVTSDSFCKPCTEHISGPTALFFFRVSRQLWLYPKVLQQICSSCCAKPNPSVYVSTHH